MGRITLADSDPNQNPFGVRVGLAVAIHDRAAFQDLELEAVQAFNAVGIAIADRLDIALADRAIGQVLRVWLAVRLIALIGVTNRPSAVPTARLSPDSGPA